jgi:hypothetical protein
MQKNRKVMSVILSAAVMMSVSALTPAFAIVPPLQDKINAVSGTGTVTLDQNYTEDITIPSGKNITLNLGGHNLTNSAGNTITVAYGASLTVIGSGTVDNVVNGKAALANSGTVTLSGGTFTRSSETVNTNTFYTILNHGTITVNDGTTVTMNGPSASEINNVTSASLVENGYYSYTSTDPGRGYVSGSNAAEPTLTINGGTFSGGRNTVKNDDGGVLNILGGSYSNESQNIVLNWNKADISNGTFTAGDNALALFSNGASGAYDVGTLTVSGGMFTGPAFRSYNGGAKTSGTITVTGGYFSSAADPSKYVPAGYAAGKSDNASYLYKVAPEVSSADGSGSKVELGSGASFTNLDTSPNAAPVVLKVNESSASGSTDTADFKTKIDDSLGSGNNIVLYDIGLYQGDTKLELAEGSAMYLYLPIPSGMDPNGTFHIYHYKVIGEDAVCEELTPVTVENGMLKVPVTGFSYYAVAQTVSVSTSSSAAASATNPKTGGTGASSMALILMAAAGAVSLYTLRVKNVKEK